ncbi:MAG: hypothetical protein MUC92_10215 [Fimbriimonadaceae bacterium]|jgi:hypothetical protein|nr:hypothetical protein [Fimbriimonadaceae bacterium]
MSDNSIVIIDEDVRERVLQGQPIIVKDHRMTFVTCFGLPALLSIWIGITQGGIAFSLFAMGLFFPLAKSIYEWITAQ